MSKRYSICEDEMEECVICEDETRHYRCDSCERIVCLNCMATSERCLDCEKAIREDEAEDRLDKASAPRIFKNKNWSKRDYEAINVVACVAEKAPGENWVECDELDLAKLTMLEIHCGVRYFGYL